MSPTLPPKTFLVSQPNCPCLRFFLFYAVARRRRLDNLAWLPVKNFDMKLILRPLHYRNRQPSALHPGFNLKPGLTSNLKLLNSKVTVQ
jgi:hypothetical protein